MSEQTAPAGIRPAGRPLPSSWSGDMTLGLGLVIVLALTFVAYWPGLHGGFTFDDDVSIVANAQVQVEDLSLAALRDAAESGVTGPLGRPLSMVSFALNHALSGLDPFGYKLTNLVLHGINVALVALLARLLLSAHARLPASRVAWIALLAAAAWALHPFNLTGVLYVVQRMTSLSSLFMLAGALSYAAGRARLVAGRGGWSLILAVPLIWFPLAVLSKETGALVFVYVLVIEVTFFRFAASRDADRLRLAAFFGLTLGLPLVLAAALFASEPMRLLGGYALRDFTLEERLLTEARVVLWYLRMILLPDIRHMGLMLDDFPLSTSLLQPPVTVLAVGALTGLVVTAGLALRRAPLVAFGILWFLAGHLVESTVLPLELAYEHRSYLASFGLLLPVSYYVLRSPLAPPRVRLRRVLVGSWILLLALGTTLRAEQWSDPHRLLLSEIAHHPRSPRNHALAGEHYLSVAREHPGHEELYAHARQHFEESLRLKPSLPSSLVGLIVLNGMYGLPPERRWLDDLERLLAESPGDASLANSFAGLTECAVKRVCQVAPDTYLALLGALQQNPRIDPPTRALAMTRAAEYFGTREKDYAAALGYAEQSVRISPTEPGGRFARVRWLMMTRRFLDAEVELDAIEKVANTGALRRDVVQWRDALRSVAGRRAQTPGR